MKTTCVGMASTARWGLKRIAKQTVPKLQQRRNGLYSPLGIETIQWQKYQIPRVSRNGLDSPLGIETNVQPKYNAQANPSRNGLYSPLGIETQSSCLAPG